MKKFNLYVVKFDSYGQNIGTVETIEFKSKKAADLWAAANFRTCATFYKYQSALMYALD